MKLFTDVLFPKLYDRVMGSPAMDDARRAYLVDVSGEVLEIGFGTGQNLPHYPAGIDRLTVIEPNPGMHKAAARRIEATPITVDLRQLNGESLPFDDASFDSVVCAYTLCTIHDVDAALAEIRRVLKPGGRFYFLEHGLSHEHHVQKWQHRLNPLQNLFAGGCNLNRDIRTLVQSQFRDLHIDEYYLDGDPKTHGYTYQGAAVKH